MKEIGNIYIYIYIYKNIFNISNNIDYKYNKIVANVTKFNYINYNIDARYGGL